MKEDWPTSEEIGLTPKKIELKTETEIILDKEFIIIKGCKNCFT